MDTFHITAAPLQDFSACFPLPEFTTLKTIKLRLRMRDSLHVLFIFTAAGWICMHLLVAIRRIRKWWKIHRSGEINTNICKCRRRCISWTTLESEDAGGHSLLHGFLLVSWLPRKEWRRAHQHARVFPNESNYLCAPRQKTDAVSTLMHKTIHFSFGPCNLTPLSLRSLVLKHDLLGIIHIVIRCLANRMGIK